MLSMGRIGKTFAILLTLIITMSCLTLLSVKPASAQNMTNPTALFTRTSLYNASTSDVTHVTNANNVAYLSNKYGTIYAFNTSNADVLWSFNINSQAPPLSVSDGTVYFGSIDAVYALNASTGTVIWKVPVNQVAATPVVANGVVFIGDSDNSVYAFNASNGIELA
jgi:outer membrane protein assembly factor BamB